MYSIERVVYLINLWIRRLSIINDVLCEYRCRVEEIERMGYVSNDLIYMRRVIVSIVDFTNNIEDFTRINDYIFDEEYEKICNMFHDMDEKFRLLVIRTGLDV